MIAQYDRKKLQTVWNLKRTMHEDRKRVFVDTFGWDLVHDGSEEHDQFDNNSANYLVGERRDGTHLVSVRLLDTESDHILGSVFPFLCDDKVPRGPQIKEITRYLASPRARTGERLIGRNMMARALIEYGLINGITMYTAVCDISFLNQVIAAGWRCDPLGLPQEVDGSIVGAFCIHVDHDAIAKMTTSWRYLKPALNTEAVELSAAA